jgi:hypothetical protein
MAQKTSYVVHYNRWNHKVSLTHVSWAMAFSVRKTRFSYSHSSVHVRWLDDYYYMQRDSSCQSCIDANRIEFLQQEYGQWWEDYIWYWITQQNIKREGNDQRKARKHNWEFTSTKLAQALKFAYLKRLQAPYIAHVCVWHDNQNCFRGSIAQFHKLENISSEFDLQLGNMMHL